LAAACFAAPHGVAIAPAATYTVAAAPAVVSVPLQKTVHYENRPVVTGYSTSIIKPAIATQTFAAPAPVVSFAQPAPVAGLILD